MKIIFVLILLLSFPLSGWAAKQEAILNINGMFCAGCADNVKKILESERGVSKATVSFEKNNATIQYDDQSIDAEKLADIVTDAGFEASVVK